jgi:hypothetical protein
MTHPKITPKNLHYDDTLPPFLQRMRANQSSLDGRHERAIARPKRARNTEEEEEDEPVYVDETGEVVRREDVEKLGEGKNEDKGQEGEEKKDGERKTGRIEGKEKIATIGGARRKKVGKLVGGDEGPKDRDDIKKEGGNAEKEKVSWSVTDAKPKGKKKVKKMKLSFNDEDGA